MAQITQSEVSRSIGPWQPLRNRTFRNLLAANLVSDIGAFMQSVGAAWLMTSLTKNPLYIALIQTATALPFFLLALPAGSIGDIFDRRKLILSTEIWMLVIAVLLTGVTLAGAMTPWLLLLLTFALSIGDAVESPTWRAIFPDLVTKEELPPALALNGIEFNLARAVGPGLGGFIVAAVGVGAAFAFNAFSFFGVIAVIAKWKRPGTQERLACRDLPRGNLSRHSLCAIFPRHSHAAAAGGSAYLLHQLVLGAPAHGGKRTEQESNRVWFPTRILRIRRSTGSDGASANPIEVHHGGSALLIATVTFAAIVLSLALLRVSAVLCVLMLFGGAAWTSIMSLFNIMVQELAPDWVRARVLAVYLFVFQGSVTAGSTLWGFMALRTSVHATLAFASLGTAACLLLRPLFQLPDTKIDLTVWNHWVKPAMIEAPDPDQGPVLVTVKYVIDPAKAPEFLRQDQQISAHSPPRWRDKLGNLCRHRGTGYLSREL